MKRGDQDVQLKDKVTTTIKRSRTQVKYLGHYMKNYCTALKKDDI